MNFSTLALAMSFTFALSLVSNVAHAEDLIGDAKAIGDAAKNVWPNLVKMPELKNAYPELPKLAEGDVFMIFAHSDDELTVIGALAELHRREPKRKIHWVMVSDNQSGQTIPYTCFGASKADCRARESGHVALCAGIPSPVRMGYLDGAINKVEGLEDQVAAKIDELREGRPVAAIYSSDETGLYGHPDHMAVHDVTSRIARDRRVPFISVALPEYFKTIIPMRPEAKGRVAPPITHALDLDLRLKAQVVCANDAYVSQTFTILKLRAGLPATAFVNVVPRQFFNVTEN